MLFASRTSIAGAILENLWFAMAMSPSSSALASGRTTRTFLMRRSYFLAASAQALLHVREQSAVAHHLHEVRGDRLALQRVTGREIRDCALLQRNPKQVAVADTPRLGAYHRRQAEVEGIAVEEPGEGLGHQRRDAEVLERRRRLLARGTGAEVAAADHDVSRLHSARELWKQRLEAVRRD